MSNTTPIKFDTPIRNWSGKNSEEKTRKAIELAKLHPDLWDKFTQREKTGEFNEYVLTQVDDLLWNNLGVSSVTESTDLFWELRLQVRREAGLQYKI